MLGKTLLILCCLLLGTMAMPTPALSTTADLHRKFLERFKFLQATNTTNVTTPADGTSSFVGITLVCAIPFETFDALAFRNDILTALQAAGNKVDLADIVLTSVTKGSTRVQMYVRGDNSGAVAKQVAQTANDPTSSFNQKYKSTATVGVITLTQSPPTPQPTPAATPAATPAVAPGPKPGSGKCGDVLSLPKQPRVEPSSKCNEDPGFAAIGTESQRCEIDLCSCIGGTASGGASSGGVSCSKDFETPDCANARCFGAKRKCENTIWAKVADIAACGDTYKAWSSRPPSDDQNDCIRDACQSGKVCSDTEFMDMCPLRGSAIRTTAFHGIALLVSLAVLLL